MQSVAFLTLKLYVMPSFWFISLANFYSPNEKTMQTFKCDECAQLLFFENNSCIRCGHLLGFSIEEGDSVIAHFILLETHPIVLNIVPPEAGNIVLDGINNTL
mgnify:CR=1 FL=1